MNPAASTRAAPFATAAEREVIGGAAPPSFLLAEGASPAELEAPQTDVSTQLDRPWNVVVWNDPISLMSYVVYVFQKLFGFTRQKATRLMLEVHHHGRSIVATTERERAELYVSRLHAHGLLATLEPTE